MKGSLMGKMPGDEWQRFANLRLLLGYMFAHPGKKLLFMGMELGQYAEWNYKQSLDWHLLQYPLHQGLRHCLADLNRLYRSESPLYADDFDRSGFEWVAAGDAQNSVLAFERKEGDRRLLVVCNFTPQIHTDYRIGVSQPGYYREIFNSDSEAYGGANQGNLGGVHSHPEPLHGRANSIALTLPPLAVMILKPE
jgi:1,4-alpha-glucan branching enzyme